MTTKPTKTKTSRSVHLTMGFDFFGSSSINGAADDVMIRQLFFEI
jgi:hypothetical protein